MEQLSVLTLQAIKGVGRKTAHHICKNYSGQIHTKKDILDCIEDAKNKGEIKTRAPSYEDVLTAAEKARNIVTDCQKLGTSIYTLFDNGYPSALQKYQDQPVTVYVKGALDIFHEKSIAVIGTREPTGYGLAVTDKLTSALIKEGYSIVSGLAIGCDTVAHETCLKHGALTCAVLPSGVDTVIPKQNERLALDIVSSGGCLLSEYPANSQVLKHQYVERDRLQAFLSRGVVVIETAINGGSYHAINTAFENNLPGACFVHPEKYGNRKQTLGNVDLIERGSALPLSGKEDLASFLSKCSDL